MSDLIKRLTRRGHPMSLGGESLFNPDGLEAVDELQRLTAALEQMTFFFQRSTNERVEEQRQYEAALATVQRDEREACAPAWKALEEIANLERATYAQVQQIAIAAIHARSESPTPRRGVPKTEDEANEFMDNGRNTGGKV